MLLDYTVQYITSTSITVILTQALSSLRVTSLHHIYAKPHFLSRWFSDTNI